jgi:hypothetical protein
VLLSLLVAVHAAPAGADWFLSTSSPGGVEVRADARLFALFAVLNAVGYDEGPVSQRHPFARGRFHPVRARVREQTRGRARSVEQLAERHLEHHPVSLARYVAEALDSRAADGALGRLLATAEREWELERLLGEVAPEYRAVQKGLLTTVDTPLRKAESLLRRPRGEVVLAVNLLQAEGTGVVVEAEGKWLVSFGPAFRGEPEALAAVAALGEAWMKAAAGKGVAGWRGGGAVLNAARARGAPEDTLSSYVAALLGRALALRVVEAPASAYERLERGGYFGLKDISRRFEHNRAVEQWLPEALKGVERAVNAQH